MISARRGVVAHHLANRLRPLPADVAFMGARAPPALEDLVVSSQAQGIMEQVPATTDFSQQCARDLFTSLSFTEPSGGMQLG